MDVSVMFFGAVDSGHADAYDTILTVAAEADRLGFTALWTPERHFQQVGQVFPNPSVLGAALAARTRRIAIRAGSLVLPLHHPLRVVEDWSIVDNLSGGGRIGLSVATGWHSKDFVLAPDDYADRRELALRRIPLLRRLWSGEEVKFPDGTGELVAVRPQPAPVSPSLPLWLTTSGSRETWINAGRLRVNILGSTMGQTREELADKIAAYRQAYAEAPEQPGSPARGAVTLMAHGFVGTDDAHAVRLVSGPMRRYFRSYIAQTAANRDGDGRAATLSEAQVEQLAGFALRRHLSWGSVVGSAGTCRRSLLDLAGLGCDEVACFVDFGLDRTDVLAGLARLAEVVADLPTRVEID